MIRIAVILAAIGILGGLASAGPITYTETTTASGSLGGTVFTNASVTVTLVGDTSNIAFGPAPFDTYLINRGSATIQIAGLPLATFTDLVEVLGSYNQPTPSIFKTPFVLFATLDNPQGTSVTGIVAEFGDPAFLNYNLTGLGPISAVGGAASGPGPTHNTDHGALVFSVIQALQSPVPATFTATPEPTGVILLSTGLLGLIGLRLRLKRT